MFAAQTLEIPVHMMRWGQFLLGSLALACGVIGIFLPLIPTTPFLLLSSYCFVRSSPRAHHWLLQHPWFGAYLREWEEQRGVRRSVKWLAVTMVTLVVALAWIAGTLTLPIRLTLTALASCGLVVVWRLPVVVPAPQNVPPHAAAVASKSPELDLDLVA